MRLLAEVQSLWKQLTYFCKPLKLSSLYRRTIRNVIENVEDGFRLKFFYSNCWIIVILVLVEIQPLSQFAPYSESNWLKGFPWAVVIKNTNPGNNKRNPCMFPYWICCSHGSVISFYRTVFMVLPLQPNEKLLYPEAQSFYKSLQRALFLLKVFTYCLGFYPTKFPSIPGAVWPKIPSPEGRGGSYGSVGPYKGGLFCTGGTSNNTSFHARHAECSSSKTLMSLQASQSSYATLTAVSWGGTQSSETSEDKEVCTKSTQVWSCWSRKHETGLK